MVAVAEITGPELSSVIAIPKNSILEENERSYVFKVLDERAVYTEIVPGVTINEMVEVKDGLKSGDRVVTTGLNLLVDGKKLKIVE